jgi:hypothetical protein
MGAADVLMALVAAAMVAVLALGAAFGATRAGLGVPEARRVGRTVVLMLGAWLAVTAALAMGGVLSASARPPSWPLLPLTAFAVIVVVTRSAAGNRMLSNIPPAWPIAAQTFRGGVELALFALGTVATSTPGPLHLDWPGAPLTAITSWPIVRLPAFLMPVAVFLHVVSLRQNLRRLRAASGVQQT